MIMCRKIISIIVCVGLNWKRFGNFTKTLSDGVNGSFLAIFNTASENGYGTVIATLAAYPQNGVRASFMKMTKLVLQNGFLFPCGSTYSVLSGARCSKGR